MTKVERKPKFVHTEDTPYLTLTGKLWVSIFSILDDIHLEKGELHCIVKYTTYTTVLWYDPNNKQTLIVHTSML